MSQDFSARDVPEQAGRTALITGANTGIGWEAARVLAGKGARVLLACRSKERGEAGLARILKEHPNADVSFLPLDLASLDSVRKAAAHARAEARLDLLINNAGIMVPPRGETEDGFEPQFGVNHLGHFGLTGLFLPLARLFSHRPAEAALPTLRAATAPEVRGGEYYGPSGLFGMSGPPVLATSSAASHNEETARRLWERSVDWTGIDPRI